MSLKSEMICNICKFFLKNPVSLPCQCLVCDEHVHDNSGHITCVTCSKVFDVPSDGFPLNKIAESILDKELHLSDEEKSLKKTFRELIGQIVRLQEEFTLKQSEMERTSFDHFAEIRRKIDLQRETLKVQMNDARKRFNLS